MISRIHSTTVLVRDQEEALAFYVGKLGWEKRADNSFGEGSRWLTVAPPGAATELVLGMAADYGRPEGTVSSDCGISLVTPDIDAAYAELSAKGVRFRQAPEPMPWGAKATWLSDPDGNTFFLSEERD
ncbi:VOC family protein [Allonocardiopsis opalescens]|uniref:Putative glyoxalase superfamily protein PhnB n=1 Tax=Allonocardiopsis opalescens TaxID=1144618 RepID=A0A2T0QE46_9ACTN|nr:VOC family protein [Allonocardiopsis opalescens]PRY02141.1 putative glyoxalase superfamily protein PhnB [Allonocardiopsis opalescens]